MNQKGPRMEGLGIVRCRFLVRYFNHLLDDTNLVRSAFTTTNEVHALVTRGLERSSNNLLRRRVNLFAANDHDALISHHRMSCHARVHTHTLVHNANINIDIRCEFAFNLPTLFSREGRQMPAFRWSCHQPRT